MTNVLAVRLDNDGDVLLTGPAIRALAAGANRLTVLGGPRGVQAARLLPGVDEIIVHRAEWIDPQPPRLDRAATLTLVERIAGLKVDEAFIFTSFHQSPLPTALLLRLAEVPRIAAISEDYPGSLLDVRHRGLAEELHEVERALSLVATLGYRLPAGDDGRLQICRSADVGDLITGAPYVVVHPGSSAPARAWAPDHHAALVDALIEEGRQVVVTGAPSERSLTAAVAAGAGASPGSLPRPGAHDLGGATALAELAEILAAADAVVVGNTGPAHLAAAVGTPIVSLFAPTVPLERWRPWKVPVRILNHHVPCAGCRARTCPIPGHPCLDGSAPGEGVSVAAVVRAVNDLAAQPSGAGVLV
jgi:ADP-heptose:LPS heptosyltransferase